MNKPRSRVNLRPRIRELYYITHIKNVQSILQRGIFSHQRIRDEDINYTPIYDEDIISRRQSIETPDGRSLWSFANLYFNARNPMLYRVRCEKSVDEIAVLGISQEILNRPDIYVTTGNAACDQSEILPISKTQGVLSKIVKETDRVWWGEADGSKRKIMAECLVPDYIPPQYVKSVYVADRKVRVNIQKDLISPFGLTIITEPGMFFRPSMQKALPPNISLLEGDMFFSRMQTLTVSVNLVGIMGKGVASRAKYQFPDVYVRYQEVCRNRQLKMGKPYLYKRESSTDRDLADEPSTLLRANAVTWFLLFPTKSNWKNDADIQGIEKGLQWIYENYEKVGIRELALPALGCGLGRLEWKDVGPLMCRYLSKLKIRVSIYMPAEKKIPEEMLTKEFLLP
jgi:O-acetyl-ADP-ribose deacetylase (regulator of RNase III)